MQDEARRGIPVESGDEMVSTAIAAEEECKSDAIKPRHSEPVGGIGDNTHFEPPPSSSHGSSTSKPMPDGLLPVHPLVLEDEVPAILRASTLMSRHTKPSVMRPNERCPPAASPRSGEGVGQGVVAGTPSGPATYHAQLPETMHRRSQLRPPCRLSVPMLAITVQGAEGASFTRLIAGSNGKSPGRKTAEMDTGTCWGAIRQAALSTQPCDRHSEQVTPGQPLVREGSMHK